MTKDSTRKWWFALLLGLMIWSFLFFMRIYWYKAWCAVIPTPCTIESVNFVDRLAFQYHSVQADFLSNVLQNFVGLFVFVTPFLLFSRKIAIEEGLVTGTVAAWNLASLELVRTLVQRPRPLVFNSPLGDGANISQYTSFYSGHTSFVALACLSFYFMMKRRYPQLSRRTEVQLWCGYALLTCLTGALRVLGGRHYPTDVLVGMMVGSLLALGIQRKRNSLS